jgi:hypothetical protein
MKLTFQVIDAVTVSGKTTSNSQQNGIKRYFPINIYFLIFFFICIVLHYKQSNVNVTVLVLDVIILVQPVTQEREKDLL